MSYTQLSFEDRTALMLESRKADFSPRTFAQQINRHHSTIYRELSRNTVNELYQAQTNKSYHNYISIISQHSLLRIFSIICGIVLFLTDAYILFAF